MSTAFINNRLIPSKETLNDCLWMGYRNDIAYALPDSATHYIEFFKNNPHFFGQDRSVFCARDIKTYIYDYLRSLYNVKLISTAPYTYISESELDLYFDQLRACVFSTETPGNSTFVVVKSEGTISVTAEPIATIGSDSTKYFLNDGAMSRLNEWYELTQLLEQCGNMPKKKTSVKITAPQLDHFITSSIRYCVGSHTIATCCHSYSLAKYFSTLPKGEQHKYGRLIIECINGIMSHYDNTKDIIDSDLFRCFCEDCVQTKKRIDNTVPGGFILISPEMITDLIPWHKLACACVPQYTVKYAGKLEPAFFSYMYKFSTGQIEKILCGCKNYFVAPSLVSYFDNIFKLEITEIPAD